MWLPRFHRECGGKGRQTLEQLELRRMGEKACGESFPVFGLKYGEDSAVGSAVVFGSSDLF